MKAKFDEKMTAKIEELKTKTALKENTKQSSKMTKKDDKKDSSEVDEEFEIWQAKQKKNELKKRKEALKNANESSED